LAHKRSITIVVKLPGLTFINSLKLTEWLVTIIKCHSFLRRIVTVDQMRELPKEVTVLLSSKVTTSTNYTRTPRYSSKLLSCYLHSIIQVSTVFPSKMEAMLNIVTWLQLMSGLLPSSSSTAMWVVSFITKV
jgi:hypothetical protein